MGGLLLAWSDGGGPASHGDWTSDESEAEEEAKGEVGETDGAFWTGDELFDRISQEVLNSPELRVEKKTHVSKAEALEMVTRKQNKLSPVQAARELLMQITGDSLEAMGRKDEKRMLLEVDRLARKIRQLLYDQKAKKFFKSPELLEDNLATFSQNSFVDKIREKSEYESEEENSMEVQEEETEKRYRKELKHCKDFDYILERTRPIYLTMLGEAARQGCDLTELAALLIYRNNYVTRRPLAIQMLNLFKTGAMSFNKVAIEKALNILERRRLTKEGYRQTRRLLKPDGVKLPTYEELSRLRRLITPPLRPYYHETGLEVGVCTSLDASLALTVRRMIQAGQGGFLAAASSSLVAAVTIGTDGAGGQREHRQKAGIGISSSHSLSSLYQLTEVSELETKADYCIDMFRDPDHKPAQCLWCPGSIRPVESEELQGDNYGGPKFTVQRPLNYQETGPVLWVERQISSPRSARPLLVALVREKRATVEEFICQYQEHEVRKLTTYVSGTETSFSPGSWVLWSPRGGRIVNKEDCRTVSVTGKTILNNPVRARSGQMGGREEGSAGLGREEGEGGGAGLGREEPEPMDTSEEAAVRPASIDSKVV
jgi:hypothetical protein